MDNKRWGKRFSTIFWWSLAILPLIIALIYFIGYHLTFNSGITSAIELSDYHTNSNGDFIYYLNFILYSGTYTFNNLTIPYIRTMFLNLFTDFGVSFSSSISILFGWMCSVFFYHVLFDVSVWIFRMIHSWLDRWCFD